MTHAEYNKSVDRLAECIKHIESVDETLVDNLLALGIISVLDLEEVGVEPLVEELKLEQDIAAVVIAAAVEEAKLIAAEKEKNRAEKVLEEEKKLSEDKPVDETTL